MSNFLQNCLRLWKAYAGLLTAFILVTATVVPLTLFSFPGPAQALCASDPMDGRWENVDLNTRGITTIVYNFRCQDQILCDESGNCSRGEPTGINVFGSCSPADCDWGERPVTVHQSGNWKYAIFDQGFARKIVWLRLESNGQLTAVSDVDYRDSREDRQSWYRFNKVSS